MIHRKFIFAIVLFSFISCEKEAKEIKLPEAESRQILSAYFTDELDTLILYLANSVSTTGSVQSHGITDADVGLFVDGQKVLNFTSSANGFYTAIKDSFEFIVGQEYEIRSTVDGMPDISAKTTFLPEIKPDSIRFYDEFVDLWFQDLPGDDYYGFFDARFYVRDTLIQRSSESFIGVNVVWPSISDALFDGQYVKARIKVSRTHLLEEIGEPNTKITGTIIHIGKLWHEFESEKWYNTPDPTGIFDFYSTENLPSNVVGGYGIFGLGNAGTIIKNF